MLDAKLVQRIVSRAEAFTGKALRVTVIENPVAGGFTRKREAAQNRRWLAEALERADALPVRTASCEVTVLQTKAAGHAQVLARDVINAALADDSPNALYLIVGAGGDGTSLEIQTELAHAYLEEGLVKIPDRICIFRLPLGTGNDGSDGRTLDATLRLLTEKSRIARRRAVRVFPNGGGNKPWYAFNIASVGIDAFITHMTNRVKKIFPGDFYKIWVDLACLFYNRLYKVGELGVRAYLDGKEIINHRERMVLYVMGESGHRTYGSNQKILPDDDNVCGVREMPLIKKLSMRPRFKNGTHRPFSEVLLYTADRLVLDYANPILVQLDGETHRLDAASFPLTMELTEPFITVLSRD